MNAILVFLYIFVIRIRSDIPIDSAMWVLGFLGIKLVFDREFFRKLMGFIHNKYMINCITIYMLTLLWMIISILINGSKDYSFVVTYIHVFIQFVTGVVLYLYLKHIDDDKNIVNYLIIAFMIQTAIEWGGFLNPTFRAIIQSTKSEYSLARAEQYQGVRALSLSGNEFFGVTVGYSFILLLFFSKRNTLFRDNLFLKYSSYIFLITGTFFAGRTGYIGLFMAIAYNSYQRCKKKKSWLDIRISIKQIFMFIALIFSVTGIVLFFYNKFQNDEHYYRLFRFTFRTLFEKAENDTFMTGSVEHLLVDMYWVMPFDTFFVGDGFYTGLDGRYYMHTDAGYMRMILLMGIIGLLGMLALQIAMIKPKSGSERTLKLFILIMILILNIKGEVLSCELIVLGTGTLFYLQDNFSCSNSS